MVNYCPNCGTQNTVEGTNFCHKCGSSLSLDASRDTSNINRPDRTTRQEIFSRAIPFFTTRGYQPQTQTDYVITFQSESRELNWIILIVLLCCGILLGAIYYFFFCPKHQVTLSLSGETDVKVTAMGNTEQAKKDAAEFMSIIQK